MKKIVIMGLTVLLTGNVFADVCTETGQSGGNVYNGGSSSSTSGGSTPPSDYFYQVCSLDRAISKKNQSATFSFNDGQNVVELTYGSKDFTTAHLNWIKKDDGYSENMTIKTNHMGKREYFYQCKMYSCNIK